MNRRRKLLIPLLFCGAMLTACDDKSAENAAAIPCRQVLRAYSVSFTRQD